MDNYKYLLSLIKKGLLLHGSKVLFIKAIPQKRQGLIQGGKLKAVYATDNVDLALFKAVIDPKKAGNKKNKRVSVHNWKFIGGQAKFWVSQNYIQYKAFSDGYVYAFKYEDFNALKKLPHEYYAQGQLQPETIIKVKANDFLKYNKLFVWSKSDLEKSKRFTSIELNLMGY